MTNKLKLLNCIASDLQIIHSLRLIHRDLHSGNILQDNLSNAYIADLGLTTSTNIDLKEADSVFGILPYIAPEVLEKTSYTTASDIYSFGMIMWEILYGIPIASFYNIVYNKLFGSELQRKIVLDELRPPIFAETYYVNLMKQCWDKEPERRPSATKIIQTISKWQSDEVILLELSESNEKFKQIMSIIQEVVGARSDETYNQPNTHGLMSGYKNASSSNEKLINDLFKNASSEEELALSFEEVLEEELFVLFKSIENMSLT
ncbi:kinase-like domain-containing protein [Gigaspora rosea]|uniref:Kinase-like domain-containing protein n=1 Tax=Gigaspora rosea TaxID=44941 RepID=A0A397VLM7_9GLOM|nr:kinase-like domain-containing protein [Gigaspora rosea]